MDILLYSRSYFFFNSLMLQVELRDVDTGNKITERFRTDEALESMNIFKTKTYMPSMFQTNFPFTIISYITCS